MPLVDLFCAMVYPLRRTTRQYSTSGACFVVPLAVSSPMVLLMFRYRLVRSVSCFFAITARKSTKTVNCLLYMVDVVRKYDY